MTSATCVDAGQQKRTLTTKGDKTLVVFIQDYVHVIQVSFLLSIIDYDGAQILNLITR